MCLELKEKYRVIGNRSHLDFLKLMNYQRHRFISQLFSYAYIYLKSRVTIADHLSLIETSWKSALLTGLRIDRILFREGGRAIFFI